MRHWFFADRFDEFLAGGQVATTHDGPIPIWAGFIIEQNARLLAILGADMTNIESQLQSDITSLVDSNTKIVALAAAQVQQITDLQGQVATLKSQISAGGTVTADDLAALDDITSKIAATAATTSATASSTATAPAPSTPAVEPQAPITSQPVDTVPATDPTATPAPSIPVQAPITSDSSTVSGADSGSGTDSTGTGAGSGSGSTSASGAQ